MINSIGNLGGQAGPAILASLQASNGSFAMGMRVLAALVALSGLLPVLLLPADRHDPVPAKPRAENR
jgi:ACS family tartrate transporter-like MFS transporter